jgi:hypothetical protein
MQQFYQLRVDQVPHGGRFKMLNGMAWYVRAPHYSGYSSGILKGQYYQFRNDLIVEVDFGTFQKRVY